MKNFVQNGDQLTLFAAADTKSGDLVAIGDLFGFAVSDALAGQDVAVSTRGVFEAVVSASDGVSVGDVIYYAGHVIAGGMLTTDPDDGLEPATAFSRVGVAVTAAAASAEAVIDLKLG